MGHEGHYQAPASAAEFWDRDGGYVYSLTRKLLGPEVNEQDAQDVAADIIERLLRARNDQGEDLLAQYSAGYTSARTGKPVTWRGFLSAKVALYVRGMREQLARRAGRELLLCDTEVSDSGERWVELFGGQIWDDYPSLSDEQFVERMRDYLATVPDTWDGPGLFQVFNEIIERIKSGERAVQVAGMSRKDTAVAIHRIRQVITEAGHQPPPGPVSIAGVVMSPAEARDALDRLRAANGNHVHRALAGHRLMTEGPKGWYHEFARIELAAFPECSVEALEGKVGGAGNGHVKEAVMHGLARMLAGKEEPGPRGLTEANSVAALAPPDDEVTPEELFEAALWHIPGIEWDASKIDAILAAAQNAYA